MSPPIPRANSRATDGPDRIKRVAARLRQGFRAADKVIRPEMVTVYAYKAPAREPG